MLKSYKYRIYPNKQQETLIQKTFGCCRFVFNQMLSFKEEIWETEHKELSCFDCVNYCNRILKNEYEWLREVDKNSLSYALRNLDSAYKKFFKEHSGFPKYKSKKNSKKSYTTAGFQVRVDFGSNKIQLPKLKLVKAKLSRGFSGKIMNATISQVPSGKYYISLVVETEHIPLPCNGDMVGLDLGLKDLLITSNGNKYENPKTLYKYERRLAFLQKGLARKTKGGQNYLKQKHKVALCYEKIANIRKDNLHKISHELICENQVIFSENLKVENMVKNHKLSKAILDASWYELTRQIAYKAEWNGRTYQKIDTYFPSSQLCSCCGYKNQETKNLSVRDWVCSQCGAHHDRDVNAAINILNEGLKILTAGEAGLA